MRSFRICDFERGRWQTLVRRLSGRSKILQGILAIVAEGKMPQVVEESGQAQRTFDQRKQPSVLLAFWGIRIDKTGESNGRKRVQGPRMDEQTVQFLYAQSLPIDLSLNLIKKTLNVSMRTILEGRHDK